MASSSPSLALAKRSSDALMMPPPPPSKRIKRPVKILDEDDYSDALSHIIARDFFPGLLETQSKQEYLDAIASEDQDWILSATQNLQDVMTPGPDGRRLRGRRGTSMTTPAASRAQATPKALQGETPSSEVSNGTSRGPQSTASRSGVNTNMSLGAFQRKYTSEDNESFYKLVDKQNHKKAERYAWMWAGNKIPAARQIAHRQRERLLAESRPTEEKNNDKALVKATATDTRAAMPETWAGQPDNNLMFTPEGLPDTVQTVMQRNEETSAAPPKAVAYDNTRLPHKSAETAPIPPSPSLSAVKDAIAGRPRPSASEASFSGASTPRVRGYAFVDSEEPEERSTLPSGSDRLLEGNGDSTPNPFKLSESSKREALHHRMVDKVARSKRHVPAAKRDLDLRTPVTPKFMSSPRVEKKGGLTPAAARLLGQVGGRNVANTPKDIWAAGKTPKRSGLREVMTPKVGD